MLSFLAWQLRGSYRMVGEITDLQGALPLCHSP
jgi:hypothetical protein